MEAASAKLVEGGSKANPSHDDATCSQTTGPGANKGPRNFGERQKDPLETLEP